MRVTPVTNSSSNSLVLGAAFAALAFVMYDGIVVTKPAAHAEPAYKFFLKTEFTTAPSHASWKAFAPAAATESAGFATLDGTVFVTLAAVAQDRRGAEIVSRDVRAADGDEWRRIAIEYRKFDLNGESVRIPVETIENDRYEKLDIATLYWVGDNVYAGPLSAKIAIATCKLIGANAAGGAIFVAAAHPGDAALASFLAAPPSIAIQHADRKF